MSEAAGEKGREKVREAPEGLTSEMDGSLNFFNNGSSSGRARGWLFIKTTIGQAANPSGTRFSHEWPRLRLLSDRNKGT